MTSPTSENAGCERCRQQDRSVLEQLPGENIVEFHGGKALESRTHFVCKACGAKWVHGVESRVGGHGRYWARE